MMNPLTPKELLAIMIKDYEAAKEDLLDTLRYIRNHCEELWQQDANYRPGIASIMDAANEAIERHNPIPQPRNP